MSEPVMATFPSPDRTVAAALRRREAMNDFNAADGCRDLLLEIGIHEGPCLAVVRNDRRDHFGRIVNIAPRVQGLAASRAIFATSDLLSVSSLVPVARQRALRGIADALAVCEIP